METEESASACLELNGREVDGRHIRVDLVTPTKDTHCSVFVGVNIYYQQQPFYQVPPGAPPTGALPNREDQLRLYEEQRMKEKEEIKRRKS
uniref:Uncharacterized protein n=1 Tax=Amphimedon queenslandica TaxID=400682 RepID=A0A1X7SZW0_AMPQE